MKSKYTMSSMHAVIDPDANVKVEFMSGHSYQGPLGGLLTFARGTVEKKEINGVWTWVFGADVPKRGAITSEGRHGLYPVIVAETEEAAVGLSMWLRSPVAHHDGVTFCSLNQMMECARAMAKAGIQINASAYDWAITEHAYEMDVAAKPESRPPVWRQSVEQSLDYQFANPPWLYTDPKPAERSARPVAEMTR
jgi:hypothetical protein